jgi:alkanesulfonate monooxygenase SsuD/methylene tetrahydromethanopterin reductase-like flavin-dependent oxidoreductase (luciferase family)
MTPIRFGWHMPAFPFHEADGPTFIAQIRAVLDAYGAHFDSVWVDDHVQPWHTSPDPDTAYLECVSTIATFAAWYPKLDFGASVFCQSYRNPALLAKTAANLQLLTGGRFIFGIGAGWMEREYRAYNYAFPSPGVRIAQLTETLEIVKRLWAGPAAAFEGAHYKITDAYCSPRPTPPPPIMIGGGGEQKMLRVVAQYADWWNLSGKTVAEFEHKLNVLRGHCDAVGRDFDTIVKTWSAENIVIADTDDEAARIATASPFPDNTMHGTAARVAEQLQAYIDLGVTHLILRFTDFPDTHVVERFVRDVMPRLKR